MTQQALAQTSRGVTDLATGEIQPFAALDIYADDGLVIPTQPDCLATISVGRKNDKGYPEASRDGTIYVHDPDGMAPGLAAALKANGGKRLTISCGFDDPSATLHQHFARYSAGRLEAYGDANQITVLRVTEWSPARGNFPPSPKTVVRDTFWRGSEEETDDGRTQHERFIEERRMCKVTWSLYFYLAGWGENGQTQILMPDGLATYRLRSTSRHGLVAVLGRIQQVWGFTHGRLRGIPLELSLTYPEVADPLGVRRKVPRWTLLFNPPLPKGIVLDQIVWNDLATKGLAAGRQLALAAPREETWEIAEQDARALAEPGDEELDEMLTGDGPAARNEAYWRREWFGQTQGSSLASEANRASFIWEHTQERTSSLAEAIRIYKNSEMQELVTAAAVKAGQERVGTSSGAAPATAAVQDTPVASPTGVSGPMVSGPMAVDVGELRRKAAEYDRIMSEWNNEPPPQAPREHVRPGYNPQGITVEQMGRHARAAEDEIESAPNIVEELTAIIEQDDTPQPPPPSQTPPPARLSQSDTEAPGSSTICSEGHRQIGLEGENCAVDNCLGVLETPSEEMGEGADWDAEGERQQREEKLFGALRQDVVGGYVFTCMKCQAEVSTVKVKDQVLPARVWLQQLLEQGIYEPLCLTDARAALRSKAKAAAAVSQ